MTVMGGPLAHNAQCRALHRSIAAEVNTVVLLSIKASAHCLCCRYFAFAAVAMRRRARRGAAGGGHDEVGEVGHRGASRGGLLVVVVTAAGRSCNSGSLGLCRIVAAGQPHVTKQRASCAGCTEQRLSIAISFATPSNIRHCGIPRDAALRPSEPLHHLARTRQRADGGDRRGRRGHRTRSLNALRRGRRGRGEGGGAGGGVRRRNR